MNDPDAIPEGARIARRRLAGYLRQLASGRITNDEFDDSADGADDAAWEIYHFAWSFYDDLHEHRLRGVYRLSPLQRQVFARCVLFLCSGLPYEWPKRAKWVWCRQRCKEDPGERLPWWKPDESVLGGLPVWGRRARERRRRREEERDPEMKSRMVDDRIWPFRRMADYKAALKNPPYLAGRATA